MVKSSLCIQNVPDLGFYKPLILEELYVWGNSMSADEPWYFTKLRSLADPLFWAPFIPILVLKFAIFHFAAIHFLYLGYHPSFGMHFEVVEAFADFEYYYLNFVQAFVQGNLPYTETLFTVNGLQVYIYTPLFLYILAAFYFVPSELLFPDIRYTALSLGQDLTFLRVGFAFVLFDIATCVVMYVAARGLTRNRAVPIVVMLLYALNPISLWWGNYLWLSTPIHTFFLVLGFYFMIRNELRWAILWMTVAAMVKQTAALFIPVILFLEYREGMKQLAISLVIMVVVAVSFSMPYLVLYPLDYLQAIIGGLGPYWFYDVLPAPTHPIPVSVLAFYWLEPFKFLVFNAVHYALPWMMFLALFWILAHWIPNQPPQQYQKQLVLLAVLLSLAAHIFLPRGIYKFYLIALLPFLILFGAILHGPFNSSPILAVPACPLDRGPLMAQLSWLQKWIFQFRTLGGMIVNNVATWWFVIVTLASIAIFSVHRYLTHIVLLLLFLILLIYGSYHYIWKTRNLKDLNTG